MMTPQVTQTIRNYDINPLLVESGVVLLESHAAERALPLA
jgi:hypothetical protein